MARQSGLTESNKEAVKILIGKGKSDSRIARILNLNKHAIAYYRNRKLRIYKNAGRPKLSDEDNISMDAVNDEIGALQNFANYPSFMNGANSRMKHLLQLRDGVRC